MERLPNAAPSDLVLLAVKVSEIATKKSPFLEVTLVEKKEHPVFC